MWELIKKLRKNVLSSVHAARIKALERDARPLCAFCNTSSYPKAKLNAAGKWMHYVGSAHTPYRCNAGDVHSKIEHLVGEK